MSQTSVQPGPVVSRSTAPRVEVPELPPPPTSHQPTEDPWLRTIAIFKLAKGTFLLGAATAALGLLSPRTAQAVSRWASELAADGHYTVANSLVAWTLSVQPRTLRLLSAATYLYSALFFAEGIGLLMDKRWAKAMTIFTTGALIPFELFELLRHASITKLGVLVGNVAILAYLVRRVREELREHDLRAGT